MTVEHSIIRIYNEPRILLRDGSSCCLSTIHVEFDERLISPYLQFFSCSRCGHPYYMLIMARLVASLILTFWVQLFKASLAALVRFKMSRHEIGSSVYSGHIFVL